MSTGKGVWLYLVAVAFPLFFILHGVNEQFGLLRAQTIIRLAAYYFIVSVGVVILSKLIVKSYEHAVGLTFILLCIFFFFGAAKDFFTGSALLNAVSNYRYFIPIVLLFACICIMIARQKKLPPHAGLFIRSLLIIFLSIEAVTLAYNFFAKKDRQKDLGDIDHSLLQQVNVSDPARRPYIFWIVMDEYSGNMALKKRWNFNNLLDSILRNKNFFVADSARSPYNYTHYSLLSTLDMDYLPELKEHSIIGFRDIVRGNISLSNTNVVTLLERLGYGVVNQTIYNIDRHATEANEHFKDADFRLVDNQTLPGRINQDIGWNFRNLFSGNRREADSLDKVEALKTEATHREQLLAQGLHAAQAAFEKNSPTFFMFHYMFTHEPFIYNADGSIDLSGGYGMRPDKYVPSINYANTALSGFVDSLKKAAGDRELVIIIQGDHGYKYDESDPLFDQEGCSIFYAIYCSDLEYRGWSNSFNSVNVFRLLFNKYFHTNLPTLENRSVNLYYR